MKRLLFLFPHPDDESFACGGTLAKYHAAGYETYLVSATSGCKGRPGPFSLTCREEVARHRERELQAAAAILGITRLIFYRIPDGSLAAQDTGELVNRIMETMRELQPHVVVTFPPDGVTGHPDHIALSQATYQAVQQFEQESARDGACKLDLYYVSIPHYYDHCPDKGPNPAVPITGKVDISAYRQKKGEALQAHRSQVYSVNRAYPGVMDGDFGVIGSYEYYTLVRSNGREIAIASGGNGKGIPLIEL
ncbi:PIG-L deacetylase family protein [Brevibacillus migulae]|uniref:PIG-L deacetylase family protein n=1 Tax=Brevibacillus migulae TaxID=1644114 RepID=UPI00106E1606|nr:PIG-L family deacetylase [Brevibacillus migulae]